MDWWWEGWAKPAHQAGGGAALSEGRKRGFRGRNAGARPKGLVSLHSAQRAARALV